MMITASLAGCLGGEVEDGIVSEVEDGINDTVDDAINETVEGDTNNTLEELREGCTDSAAHNYDPNATDEDNTCDYDFDDDGVLDADEIRGCTDFNAINYNSEATDENGACMYFQPETRDELKTAVDEWNSDSGQCKCQLWPH